MITNKKKWVVYADMGYKRIYCATSVFNNKVWVCGGDLINQNEERQTTSMTQIICMKDGTVSEGIPLDVMLPSPLSFRVHNRLYIFGFQEQGYYNDKKLAVRSIGDNETCWSIEPDGPIGSGAIYGCEFGGKIYIAIANRYIAVFDPENSKWSTFPMMKNVRSPLVSHYNNELWVMGGRDQENQAATQIYNFQKKQWRRGPDLPRELAWGVAFNINGKMYITGGAGGKAYSNLTYQLEKP